MLAAAAAVLAAGAVAALAATTAAVSAPSTGTSPAAGITAPIVPGILPIENWKGARNFAKRCGTHIPAWVSDAFDKAERDGRSDLLATALCTEMCSDLLDGGVDSLHFYTLNRPELTRDVCHALGVVPQVQLENVA